MSYKQTDFVLSDGSHAWELPNVRLQDQKTSRVDSSIWLLLASAFLGGIILNLMPCVLPVLSIKFLSLAKASELKRAKEAILYALGVVTTFVILGAAFLALKAAGSSIGWGFQLQSPPIILLLICLFWLMGLNFLGFFEFGFTLMNVAGEKSRNSGSFATGILSVFVAAPCTGPFMGSALGAAATLPPLGALGIFFSLGLGLAFPFLLLAFTPQLLRYLPKPGAWMILLKEFFAFPLFSTVIWLLWVLEIQIGIDASWITCSTLLFLTFAIWLGKRDKKIWQVFAWTVSLVILAIALNKVQKASAAEIFPTSSSQWAPFQKEKINSAQLNHQAVFVDFTAAWCISCQVNQQAVLDTARTQQFFADHHALLLKADWTKQDPEITAALASFGRNSVPVYVFYDATNSAPQILPQILTFATIENLFKTNDK